MRFNSISTKCAASAKPHAFQNKYVMAVDAFSGNAHTRVGLAIQRAFASKGAANLGGSHPAGFAIAALGTHMVDPHASQSGLDTAAREGDGANLQAENSHLAASGRHKQAASTHEAVAQLHREAATLFEAASSEEANKRGDQALLRSYYAHSASQAAIPRSPKS